ncbi:hypothetical protein TNCV_738071 [Trichonephila clavipes]|nr:hypothetical protein TNCV_738071 [Trichonephila clavipes]
MCVIDVRYIFRGTKFSLVGCGNLENRMTTRMRPHLLTESEHFTVAEVDESSKSRTHGRRSLVAVSKLNLAEESPHVDDAN